MQVVCLIKTCHHKLQLSVNIFGSKVYRFFMFYLKRRSVQLSTGNKVLKYEQGKPKFILTLVGI